MEGLQDTIEVLHSVPITADTPVGEAGSAVDNQWHTCIYMNLQQINKLSVYVLLCKLVSSIKLNNIEQTREDCIYILQLLHENTLQTVNESAHLQTIPYLAEQM